MSIYRNQIIFFGFIFHLLAAVFSTGYHQCDELFQVFEFAGYKLGINNIRDLPWEFSSKMRSGLQPLIVYSITNFFHQIHVINPFYIAAFIRILQSMFSFLAMYKFMQLFEKQIQSNHIRKLYWFLGMLLWCIPYFHARFSSENFSSSLFLFGFSILYQSINHHFKWFDFFIAGVFFGLSFIVRFQTAFFLSGLILWLIFILRFRFKNFLFLFTGFLLPLCIGVLIDFWLYDDFVFSWWNYLEQNLFQHKADGFGTEPFYYYFTESFLQLIPPFSILMIYSVFLFCFNNTRNVLTWMIVPFILFHSIVPHKELRFLFPLINFLPFLLCYTLNLISEQKNRWQVFLFSSFFIRFAFIVNLVLLVFFTFKPADENTNVLIKISQVVLGEKPILLYKKTNPYNNMVGLNYFKKRNITTTPLDEQLNYSEKDCYFFYDGFTCDNFIIMNHQVYIKQYSRFPDWITYFNFNGWLQRANSFSIYKRI